MWAAWLLFQQNLAMGGGPPATVVATAMTVNLRAYEESTVNLRAYEESTVNLDAEL